MEQDSDGEETSNTALWVVLGVIFLTMALTFAVQMHFE